MSKRISEETLQKIREEIKNGKSKYRIAQELKIPYRYMLKHTKDIPVNRGIPQELRDKIRQEVLNGKSKRRVSIELGVSEKTVQYYTGDLWITPFRKINIQDRKLELMKDLLRDGYAFASQRYTTPDYIKLKTHFPKISKVKMYGRVIFFLEGKEDIAANVFLRNTHKKIISYQELKQVTKTFNVDLKQSEKKGFIGRNRQRIQRKKPSITNKSKAILKETQSKIDDFLGRFLHSEVLYWGFIP